MRYQYVSNGFQIFHTTSLPVQFLSLCKDLYLVLVIELYVCCVCCRTKNVVCLHTCIKHVCSLFFYIISFYFIVSFKLFCYVTALLATRISLTIIVGVCVCVHV